MFPLFRARYLAGTKLYSDPSAPDKRETSAATALSNGNGSQIGSNVSVATGPARLGRLDLRALAREDGQPTEVCARRQKMAAFEKKCSEIVDKLFISGEWVAKNVNVIQQNRITHVINCVAALYPPFHEHICTYKNLFLQGAPAKCPPIATLCTDCPGGKAALLSN
jgi:hypothetical protein